MYLVHICTKYIMYFSTYYVLVHNYVVMPPFVLFCAIFFCSVQCSIHTTVHQDSDVVQYTLQLHYSAVYTRQYTKLVM